MKRGKRVDIRLSDQLSPEEWWNRARSLSDQYVSSFPVRLYKERMRARSEAMYYIQKYAKEHPRASEILQLISEAGWNV